MRCNDARQRGHSPPNDLPRRQTSHRWRSRQCRPIMIRALHCKLGVLPQPEGSAFGQLGRTKVLAAVYGPRTPHGSRDAEANVASVVVEYREGLGEPSVAAALPASEAGSSESQNVFSDAGDQRWWFSRGRAALSESERAWSAALSRTLECVIVRSQYPRLQIRVHVWVLEEDGSSLALATTVAWAACLDAGIALYDVLLGIAVAVGPLQPGAGSTSTCIPFPTARDEHLATHGHLWIALLPNLGLAADMRWYGARALGPATAAKAHGDTSRVYFPEALLCAQQTAASIIPELRTQLIAQMRDTRKPTVEAWLLEHTEPCTGTA